MTPNLSNLKLKKKTPKQPFIFSELSVHHDAFGSGSSHCVHWTCSPGASSMSQLPRVLEGEPRALIGWWPEILVGGALHKAVCHMAAGFPQSEKPKKVREREGQRPRLKSQPFYNLISGVTSHYVFHIPFRGRLLGLVHTQRKT